MKKLLFIFFMVFAVTCFIGCGEKEDTKTPTPDVPTGEPTPEDPTQPVEPTPDVPTEPDVPTQPVEPTPGDPTEPETLLEYTVSVKDIAGKPLSDFYVTVMLNKTTIDERYTNVNGTCTFELAPDFYDVYIEGREGYYLNQSAYKTDLIGSKIEIVCELDTESLKDVNAPEDNVYELGDVMYDFEVEDTNGNIISLYELLETKKVVLLNFWYTTCSACYYEFPYMTEAYGSSYVNGDGVTVKYSDDVAIIAINPGIAGNQDTMEDIKNFKQSMNLNFDVVMDYDSNTNNLTMDPALTRMFGITGYPTTVVIDSYKLIADIHEGSITSTEKWTQTFDKYISDTYEPVYTGEVNEEELVKPNISQEESSVLEAAINGVNFDGTTFSGSYSPEDNADKDVSWPWIVADFNGKKTIKPSNKDVNPSFAIVYTTVNMKKGQVFTFDYYSSTEEYDILYLTVNGFICTNISGQSSDWETSYAYVAIEDGEYEFGFCYLKDGSYSIGEDAVYLTNLRILEEKDIDKPTYVFREAAYGKIDEFTMSYQKYVEAVYNENDGYYHVGTENGPLLFADLLSGTRWNDSDLYNICLEGKCIGFDGVDYNATIEKYTIYASNSTIGYCPITEELANALKQVVKALGHEAARKNINQWLEVCVYYSAYGTDGTELGIPTTGVCPFEPIVFEGDGVNEPAKAQGTFDRIILPRGLIFGFTPIKSGVYKFYSTEETLETIGWICDSNGDVISETDTGLRIFAEKLTNGEKLDQNFVSYIYLEAGKTYLFRAAFYDVYEYSDITVEIQYEQDIKELLTIASPGFFTSSDDEMSDIISGNFVDVKLGSDGYYHVVDSKSSDDFVYCDIKYINNITTYSILDCLTKFDAFNFGKDEFGNSLYDEEGYFRVSDLDDDGNLVRYYVCYDNEGNPYYVKEVGENGYTEENGYKYEKFDPTDLESLKNADCSDYVQEYIDANMITDENSELYGCVKVNEKFAKVLGLLMDKYTFAGVEGSWLKLCYYYKYVGPQA